MPDLRVIELDVRTPPDPHLVALLKRMLAMAQEGQIVGVAIAAELSDGATATTYEADRSDANRLVGAVARLQHRLLVEGS